MRLERLLFLWLRLDAVPDELFVRNAVKPATSSKHQPQGGHPILSVKSGSDPIESAPLPLLSLNIFP